MSSEPGAELLKCRAPPASAALSWPLALAAEVSRRNKDPVCRTAVVVTIARVVDCCTQIE